MWLALTVLAANDVPLPALQWQQRVVIVFAKADDERLGVQRRIFAEMATALEERDVALVWVIGGIASVRARQANLVVDAAQLRRALAVGPEAFVTMLVGKDGTVKLRTTVPLTDERLCRAIDAMPMRRREARR